MTPEEIDELIEQAAQVADVRLIGQQATPYMRAWLTAEIATLMVHSPERIGDFWNPWKCPVELLPWLAWALSVDVWDEDWPEVIKRRVIASSPMVHRIKGSVQSTEDALAAMVGKPRISEWWEQEPPKKRGTFEVTTYVNEQHSEGLPLLSERLQRQVIESIYATKPKSRQFTYRLGVDLKSELGVGAKARCVGYRQEVAEAKIAPQKLPLGLGAAVRTIGYTQQMAETKLAPQQLSLRLGALLRGISFHQIIMEV
ncbi:hypothetical protein GCM10007094_23920 [Pseudovibrio japonicus]|uniref:Phage tail protein I n=1 Tax=Pseudovibrio japonicus TaxID=366534 RepID=A0ABQ3EGQ9_9HYPH|nr:phage tail protein I [Pseudovibrio japonicus]GHB34084.1 hypothetical protein GCM10007094_23920 [Pseudovibrio japonicus]